MKQMQHVVLVIQWLSFVSKHEMHMFGEAAESVLHSLLTSDYGECLHISPFLQSELHVEASKPHHICDQAISK